MEKKLKQNFPDALWFEENGTPLKKVGISADSLGNLSEEKRDVIAMSTYALLERRLVTIAVFLGVLGALLLTEIAFLSVCFIETVIANALFDLQLGAIVVGVLAGITILAGVFCMPVCYYLLNGFCALNGADRLNLPDGRRRVINAFCKISKIWGIAVIALQPRKKRKGKDGEILVQVAIPENCGYERLIDADARKNDETETTADDGSDAQLAKKEHDKLLWLSVICETAREGKNWGWGSVCAARRNRRRIFDPFPGKKWFKDNGTPVTEIAIHTELLDSFSDDEKDLLSMSTYGLVKSRIKQVLTFLCIFAVGLVVTFAVGLPVSLLLDDVGIGITIMIYGIIILVISFAIGSVFALSCSPIIDGFLFMDGVERLYLDVNPHFRRKLKIFRTISFIWAILLILVLSWLGGLKSNKVEYFLHVGIPEHCGYDKIISLYKAKGEVALADVANALQESYNNRTHEKYGEKLNKLLTEVKEDKQLTDEHRRELENKINEKRDEDDEKYKAAQSVLEGQRENEINPANESIQRELDGGDLTEPYVQSNARYMKGQIAAHILDECENYLNPKEESEESGKKRVSGKVLAVTNIFLPAAAALCLLAAIITFFIVGILGFIPLLLSLAFAVAGIAVNYKTHARTILKIVSVSVAALFILFTTLFSALIISGKASADGGDNGGGTAPSDSVSYDFDYEVYEGEYGQEIKVTGCYDGYSHVTIPSYIGGIPVTRIEGLAFNGLESLTDVTIPESIREVGDMAFLQCPNLTRIDFMGTMEEWEAIFSDNCYGEVGDFLVYCSDGVLNKYFEYQDVELVG